MTESQPAIAAKELSAVEVDRSTSNQHELNAGRLRRLLFFDDRSPVEGELHVLVFHSDDEAALSEDRASFTLYDARAQTPKRSEWRLYYKSEALARHASAGDLLVLVRPDIRSPDLHALVARQGTEHARRMRELLDIGDDAVLRHFQGLRPGVISVAAAGDLALPPASGNDLARHPSVNAAVSAGRMPSSQELANAAHETVLSCLGDDPDPDRFLSDALDAESSLFFAAERQIGEMELRQLLASGAGFVEVLKFAQSKHQSRRSRRGQSLQRHLARLFELKAIRHSAQCETENGERPDFIVPGCREYHDPSYPESALRMIGCKTTLRERWRQHLSEARRIALKYHLTVDPAISDELIRQMHAESLRLFMPRDLIMSHYASQECEGLVRSVADLIDDLLEATTVRGGRTIPGEREPPPDGEASRAQLGLF